MIRLRGPGPSWFPPGCEDLAALDDAEGVCRAMFSGSPIKRIGRDRFVRNVLYAIGNSGEKSGWNRPRRA